MIQYLLMNEDFAARFLAESIVSSAYLIKSQSTIGQQRRENCCFLNCPQLMLKLWL